MRIISTPIPDLYLIEPKLFEDERGFFMETFRETALQEIGVRYCFVQDNHSGSVKGVLRGLHYQIQQPQGKLVRAGRGKIFDVAVDLRRSSPTFGQWFGEILSEKNRMQLWIPAGFAHGFYALSEWAELIYKATDYYAPQWERTLFWNDPMVDIRWPIDKCFPPILSPKDGAGKLLKEADLFD